MRISDLSSDVCSSDLPGQPRGDPAGVCPAFGLLHAGQPWSFDAEPGDGTRPGRTGRAAGWLEHRWRAGQGGGLDRKSVVEGTSGSVRVDLGGRRLIKKKIINKNSSE